MPTEKPSRLRTERDPAPTDLAEKMIALKRRTADSSTRTRERPSPPTSRASPAIPRVVSGRQSGSAQIMEADSEEFSRRLNISCHKRPAHTSPRQAHATGKNGKLYNPQTDPIPMRRTADPEVISDATSSSYAPRGTAANTPAHQRQLFDHRKDDPVRFSVLARPSSRPTPTPKSSVGYVSASSTSSYAPSIASSSFTLSSNTTDNSSASSAAKPNTDESSNNFAVQLKKLYRGIAALETKILNEDMDESGPEEGRIVLKERGKDLPDEDAQVQKWNKLIGDHKRLAEMMHNLLEISLAPSVPASLRNIPTKYNIIIRLWTHGFHKLLESLRRASFASLLALEHLQDFIYYAYTFYTGILEEQDLRPFRAGWLEALGDLARYRMAVAAMVTGSQAPSPEELTTAAVETVLSSVPDQPSDVSVKSGSIPAVRIDDSPSPSVGLAAARLLDVEPEKERWRGIARDWYAQGLADTPGTGKLHHHLGLLSREKDGEELRSIYHFVKSMTTLHPFSTSRESILPVWSSSNQQARLSNPSTCATDLFVLLHGMLFTHIQLDDFTGTLARFLERLEMEGDNIEEREWIMMGVVNLGAILEYGRASGVIRRSGGLGTREGSNLGAAAVRVVIKKPTAIVEDDDAKMDIDDFKGKNQTSPATSEADEATGSYANEYPASFKLAAQLTFAMLSHVLKNPMRKSSPFAKSTLNPYMTIVLTFLATISRHPASLSTLERTVPWDKLATFFATVPRTVMLSQGLNKAGEGERWAMLTSGCAPPLDEDWCLRGMEWVGRRVFERGYWKSGEEKGKEVEILEASEPVEVTDGIIEDDGDEGTRGGEAAKRWVRIVRCAVCISQVVDGFQWVEGTRDWRIDGALERKVLRWKEEARLEQEADERRQRGHRWADDAMNIDEEEAIEESSESEDDENDTPEVKELKARRRYLLSLLQSSKRSAPVSSSPPSRRAHNTGRRKLPVTRAPLPIVPGYTVLVVDTNILLSSLSMLAPVIESLRWTIIIPVPVIMELDGLSSNSSQLGEAAQAAMKYISSHFKSHSTSLKVQTSKGNYLSSLSIRTEQVDFQDEASWERNMDDLILRAAIWQDEHWIDRSAILKDDGVTRATATAVKVVLLSLDRNLRLKARSKQLPAASEHDLASILSTGT